MKRKQFTAAAAAAAAAAPAAEGTAAAAEAIRSGKAAAAAAEAEAVSSRGSKCIGTGINRFCVLSNLSKAVAAEATVRVCVQTDSGTNGVEVRNRGVGA
jgi:hypothetical protein